MGFNRYTECAECARLAEWFRAEGECVALRRGELFAVRQGRSRLVGWIERGAFRYFCPSPSGVVHTVGFAFAGEFVGDYAAMGSETVPRVGIEAMCDSRVLRLPVERLEAYYGADAARERLGRRVAEHLLAEVYERLLLSRIATPQERYEALLRRCPELFDAVPLRDVASLLGVRPETLSRIRRRIR